MFPVEDAFAWLESLKKQENHENVTFIQKIQFDFQFYFNFGFYAVRSNIPFPFFIDSYS